MKPLCCAVLLAAACAHERIGAPPLANWYGANPVAAQQLCAFNHQYPSQSNDLRKWVRDHPAQAQELLEWVAENPRAPLPLAFVPIRARFGVADRAVFLLQDWAAMFPDAAMDLSANPAGLRVAFGPGGC